MNKIGCTIRFIADDAHTIHFTDDYAYFINSECKVPLKLEGLSLLSKIKVFYENNSDEDIVALNKKWYDDMVSKEREMNDCNKPCEYKPIIKEKIPGCTYILKSSGYYKIGKTKNLEQRLKSFHSSWPCSFTLIHTIKTDSIDECEKYFHSKYAFNRLHGEWFELAEKDIKEMQLITEKNFGGSDANI